MFYKRFAQKPLAIIKIFQPLKYYISLLTTNIFMTGLCSELFRNSSEIVGTWHGSSALYGIDIIFYDMK